MEDLTQGFKFETLFIGGSKKEISEVILNKDFPIQDYKFNLLNYKTMTFLKSGICILPIVLLHVDNFNGIYENYVKIFNRIEFGEVELNLFIYKYNLFYDIVPLRVLRNYDKSRTDAGIAINLGIIDY